MAPAKAHDWLLLSLLSVLWGTAFTFTRTALDGLPPLSVAAGRILLGALLLTAIAYGRGTPLPRDGARWRWFGVLALFGNALPFFAIGWGQERVDSGLAGILMAVMPLATLVLAHFYVESDRITAPKAAGFVLGFAGIVVLMGPEALSELGGSDSQVFRQAAVLGGALCYALYAVLVPRAPETPPLLLAAGSLIMASLVMVPLAVLIDRPWELSPGGGSLLAVSWLGVVATALATLIYFRLLSRTGPTFVALINFLIPLVALAAGMLAMGEEPGKRVWLALGLILAGLALAQQRKT
ncbi:MAG: DMT family transporter [Myxococcales bacterium]|nr:DMT family transporter [Myxococcales bacterium]